METVEGKLQEERMTIEEVSTLPIRNGNLPQASYEVWTTSKFCKYLTYKEWKQIRFTNFHSFWKTNVSTLPIRNITQPVFWYICWVFPYSHKKDSSTVSDTAAFLHCLYFIFFSDTVYLFIYSSNIYSKSFLTFIFYILTFQFIYIIFRNGVSLIW